MIDFDTLDALRGADFDALDFDARDTLDAADYEAAYSLLGYQPRPGVRRNPVEAWQ